MGHGSEDSDGLGGHCVQLKGQFWSMFTILNPAIVEISDGKNEDFSHLLPLSSMKAHRSE